MRFLRATHLVCAFQYWDDAQRFYEVLGKRLNKYSLELAADKTKIINFDRFNKQATNSFEFLGFEYRWAVNKNGKTLGAQLETS